MKHGGQTDADNLALACKLCNTFKGSDIASIDPKTKKITRLYQPRRDSWQTHFQTKNGELIPFTAIARTTVWLLQLNSSNRLQERRLWIVSGLVHLPITSE
ncbi:MAG: HNH endonuclease [Phormidesmis sp.]